MSRYSREYIDKYLTHLSSDFTKKIIKQLLADQDRLCESVEICLKRQGDPVNMMAWHYNLLKEIRG